MAVISVEGHGSFEAAPETRLVNAIESQGIDILHRCGGNARCTTCRVEFIAGEPARTTAAEQDKLIERGLWGQARLSCQILCDHPMEVRVVMHLAGSDLSDAGPTPEPTITPTPEWRDISASS